LTLDVIEIAFDFLIKLFIILGRIYFEKLLVKGIFIDVDYMIVGLPLASKTYKTGEF